MNVPLAWLFHYLLIPTLQLTTRLGGERVWRAWQWLTVALASLVGWLARQRRPAGESPVVGMMWLVDQADKLIGAEGAWVETGPTRAVKRITRCPHAERLRALPAFCTRLGVVMGERAFRAYAPNVRVDYAIPQALSQGDPCCEYVLTIRCSDDPSVSPPASPRPPLD